MSLIFRSGRSTVRKFDFVTLHSGKGGLIFRTFIRVCMCSKVGKTDIGHTFILRRWTIGIDFSIWKRILTVIIGIKDVVETRLFLLFFFEKT